jgi:hypothetical protein
MSRKKYISTGANPLSIDVMDEGVLYSFDFRGGLKHPVFKPPVYITSNVKEQQLLEKSPAFNVLFISEEVIDEKPQAKEDIIVEQEPVPKDIELPNAQEAKKWLNKKHGISFTKLNNKAKVIAIGQELGFNILFESDKN